MIKELISDLAFDRIKLSQALTRSKIIASKIKNEKFKNWITKELEGYKTKDEFFPNYRKIYSPITITAEFPFGRTETYPVVLPDSLEKQIGNVIYYFDSLEPISIIEEQISSISNAIGYINLPPQQLAMLADLYKKQIDAYNGVITKGHREIGKVQFQKILELTKQRLLDTLMELDNEFPNLLNEYVMTKENNDKIQNIVTNHIYGSSGPMNVAAGHTVEQSGNQIFVNNIDYSALKELGVEDVHIEEIKKIVSESGSDKPTLKTKAMKWLGSVTASIAAKGLYDNIPAITEFVEKLI